MNNPYDSKENIANKLYVDLAIDQGLDWSMIVRYRPEVQDDIELYDYYAERRYANED